MSDEFQISPDDIYDLEEMDKSFVFHARCWMGHFPDSDKVQLYALVFQHGIKALYRCMDEESIRYIFDSILEELKLRHPPFSEEPFVEEGDEDPDDEIG